MTGPARDEKADGTNPSSVAKPVGGPTRKGNLSNGEDGPTESASNPRADHPSPAPPSPPRCARCGHRSDYHNESMLDSPCWQDFGLTIPQECDCHAFVPPAEQEGTPK